MNREKSSSSDRWWRSPTGFILVAFLAIAAFFLITEHRAHLFNGLPFLLLLLCPLLHWLMHGGHGSHAEKHPEGDKK